jgi:hypothetical protein
MDPDALAEGAQNSPSESGKTSSGEVLAAVAAKVNSSSSEVRDRVVATLVERELAVRTETVEKTVAKLKELSGEFKKIRADVVAYDESGVTVTSNWSKEQLEKKNKARAKVDQLEKALGTYFEKGDADSFNKLKDQLGKS